MNVHYFNHALLPGIAANKIQRISMANAFSKIPSVTKIYFYFILNDENELDSLRRMFNKKVVLKPILVKDYSDPFELKSGSKRTPFLSRVKLYFKFMRIISDMKFEKDDLIYIRGDAPSFSILIRNFFRPHPKYIIELHNDELNRRWSAKDFLYRQAFKRAKKVITISEYTKRKWISNSINREVIAVLPSAVDLSAFKQVKRSKKELRKELGLPQGKKIILYTGHLYRDRGIEILLEASKKNPSCTFIFVGGQKDDVDFYKEYAGKLKCRPNLIFTGYKDHGMMPKYMKSADILVAPYSTSCSTQKHMSPLKLFEYMASGVPILISDLPRIRDVVSNQEVFFFKPDDSADLNQSLGKMLHDYDNACLKAKKAYAKAELYTYLNRAIKIISFND
jgi:glycosyltransferase involved in cell wall biosynthesis